jgi:hypothetical protein
MKMITYNCICVNNFKLTVILSTNWCDKSKKKIILKILLEKFVLLKFSSVFVDRIASEVDCPHGEGHKLH